MKGYSRHLKYTKGKDGHDLKIFSNFLRTRAESVGVIRRKDRSEGNLVFSSDIWRSDTKNFTLVHFTGPDNF